MESDLRLSPKRTTLVSSHTDLSLLSPSLVLIIKHLYKGISDAKFSSQTQLANPDRKSGSQIRIANPGRKSGSQIQVATPGRYFSLGFCTFQVFQAAQIQVAYSFKTTLSRIWQKSREFVRETQKKTQQF